MDIFVDYSGTVSELLRAWRDDFFVSETRRRFAADIVVRTAQNGVGAQFCQSYFPNRWAIGRVVYDVSTREIGRESREGNAGAGGKICHGVFVVSGVARGRCYPGDARREHNAHDYFGGLFTRDDYLAWYQSGAVRAWQSAPVGKI